jgi:hypothetical protein
VCSSDLTEPPRTGRAGRVIAECHTLPNWFRATRRKTNVSHCRINGLALGWHC